MPKVLFPFRGGCGQIRMVKFTLSIESKGEQDVTLLTAWLLDALEQAKTLETLEKSGDLWDGEKCVGTCKRVLPECLEQAQAILFPNAANEGRYWKNNNSKGLQLTCGHPVLYDALIERICHEFH